MTIQAACTLPPTESHEKMPKFLPFLLVAALGNICYHLGQKSLHGENAHPMLMLSIYYGIAMLLCLLAFAFWGKTELAAAVPLLGNWRMWLVAVGTILIELGFLMAYHAGGSPQWGGVAVNGMAALLLIPLSLLLFGEHFSWQKAAGVLLTLLGLWFMVKK